MYKQMHTDTHFPHSEQEQLIGGVVTISSSVLNLKVTLTELNRYLIIAFLKANLVLAIL